MGRPPKSVNVLESEGRSHRTKAEIEQRKKGEESLLSGEKLIERTEVKADRVAHKEFLRVRNLMKTMEKDDALYSAVMNRYCLLYAECLDFENKREEIQKLTLALQQKYDKTDSENEALTTFAKLLVTLERQILNFDSAIMQKRKMMFDIEKENIMTVASGLRSIPKAPSKDDENPLLKALQDDADG